MIAVTRSARLAAALLCAGLALAGPAPAVPEAGAVSQAAKQLYEAARQAEEQLRGSETAMRNRDRWQAVARRYRSVVLSYPRSGYCDDALHYEGGIYRDAAERFDDRRFAVRAADAFALLVRGYPASRWVPKALYEQVRLHAGRLDDDAAARRALERLRERAPRAAETRMAAAILNPPASPRRAAENEPPPREPASRPAGTRRPGRSRPIRPPPCRTSATGSGTRTPGW